MIAWQKSPRDEFPPALSCGPVFEFAYMMPPENFMPARVSIL